MSIEEKLMKQAFRKATAEDLEHYVGVLKELIKLKKLEEKQKNEKRTKPTDRQNTKPIIDFNRGGRADQRQFKQYV